MTIRIYALAKDLNVDSKVLIDLCQQLGIKNEAAALTLLTDNNVAKIKDYLASHPPVAADFAAPVANAPIPPSSVDFGKVPSGTQKSKSRSKPKAPAKSKASDIALSNLTDDVVAKIKTHLKQLSSKKESYYPVRIYSLAKEIGIEIKVLCDLCQQLGISCRGGALTNLMSDDVAKIKAHFEQ